MSFKRFHAEMPNVNPNKNSERINQIISTQGYILIESVFSSQEVEILKKDLKTAIELEDSYHGTANRADRGMVLVCPMYSTSFIDILAHAKFLEPLNAVLGEGSIVYAYTSSSMPPQEGNPTVRIHVDSPRLIPNYVTNMGAIILLDSFTENNGATYFLPGSHTRAEAPSEKEFLSQAQRLIAPAGSVFYFHARLWHSGAKNNTDNWRHALTINMCRPFMKQRLDLPRLLCQTSVDVSSLPETALQKLGFYSQVPASLDEYYQPPEKRKFRQKAE